MRRRLHPPRRAARCLQGVADAALLAPFTRSVGPDPHAAMPDQAPRRRKHAPHLTIRPRATRGEHDSVRAIFSRPGRERDPSSDRYPTAVARVVGCEGREIRVRLLSTPTTVLQRNQRASGDHSNPSVGSGARGEDAFGNAVLAPSRGRRAAQLVARVSNARRLCRTTPPPLAAATAPHLDEYRARSQPEVRGAPFT